MNSIMTAKQVCFRLRKKLDDDIRFVSRQEHSSCKETEIEVLIRIIAYIEAIEFELTYDC